MYQKACFSDMLVSPENNSMPPVRNMLTWASQLAPRNPWTTTRVLNLATGLRWPPVMCTHLAAVQGPPPEEGWTGQGNP